MLYTLLYEEMEFVVIFSGVRRTLFNIEEKERHEKIDRCDGETKKIRGCDEETKKIVDVTKKRKKFADVTEK